jgi:hypothetical protein
MLIESKSNLAKLMATENISIEQRNVRTAYFDVKNRILVIPFLDGNLSPQLYDLLLGHEVGHALETPEEGLHHSIKELKVSRSILNVCEDVRIEKKIKRKFPGIKQSFIKGYTELIEKDFFGVNGMDLNSMNFIDRINLHTKGGASQGIRFTEEENVLLKEVEAAETFDETVAAAMKVQEYMKMQKEKEKAEKSKDFFDDSDDFGDDPEDLDNSDDYYDDILNEDADPDEDDSKKQQKQSPDDSDSEKSDDSDEKSNKISDGVDPGEEITSHTDNKFRQREKELFSESMREITYGNIPELRLGDIVIPHQKLYSEIKKHRSDFPELADITKAYIEFRTKSNKVVSYLVKEFELRKNADQMKRASVSKTGELNMQKIHAYQLSEDLFKRMTVVPNGKSHGLVMFLDWSGSMSKYINNTVKQVLNLVLFCKKVNIPFDVYAFSSDNPNYLYTSIYGFETQKPKVGDICIHGFGLLNIFSSKMTAAEFSYAAGFMLHYTSEKTHNVPVWFRLGGTPLNEAIVAAMQIVPKFKKDHKIQIVNTVFLTDGQGSHLNTVFKSCDDNTNTIRTTNNNETVGVRKKFVVRDPVTSTSVEMPENYYHNSVPFLKLLKERTQSNVIGFYITSARDLNHYLRNMYPNHSHEKTVAEFRSTTSIVMKNSGYDEFYVIKSDKMDVDDEVELEVKKTTARSIATAFKKYSTTKVLNRVILNKFIQMIA